MKMDADTKDLAASLEHAILYGTPDDLYLILLKLPHDFNLKYCYRTAAENGKLDQLLALLQYESEMVTYSDADPTDGGGSRWAKCWRSHQRYYTRRGKLVANLYTAIYCLFQCGVTGQEHLYQFLDIILENNVDLNMVDGKGETILMRIACHPIFGPSQKLKPIITKMLSGNLYLSQQNRFGETALSKSILYYNFSTTMLLVEVGADVTTKDYRGRLPLHELSEKGADSQLEGEDVCQLVNLVSSKSDKTILDSQDNQGLTALMISAQLGNHKMVQALLQQGCDPTFPNDRNDNFTALHYLLQTHIKSEASRRTQILMELIRNGSNIDQTTDMGLTPLTLAIKTCNPHAVKVLLQANCAPITKLRQAYCAHEQRMTNIEGAYGHTCVHCSAHKSHDAMWDALGHFELNLHQMLIRAGYDLDSLRNIAAQIAIVKEHYIKHAGEDSRTLYRKLPTHLKIAESLFVTLSTNQIQWIFQRARTPYSLKEQCCQHIRKQLGSGQQFITKIQSLGLPGLLQDYVALKKMDELV